MVLVVVSSLPAAANRVPEKIDSQTLTTESELGEAEQARALALSAGDVQRMQKAAAKEGLYLDTNQYPLVRVPGEQGQEIYVSGSQAVAFLGETGGQRLYEIALGFEGISNTQALDRIMKRPIVKRPSVNGRDSFMLMMVDMILQRVVLVRQFDLYAGDSLDGRSMMMRRPDGSRSRYLETKAGWQQEMIEDGVTRQKSLSLVQPQCQGKAPGLMRRTSMFDNLPRRITVCNVVCSAVTGVICVAAFVTVLGGLFCGVVTSIMCEEYCTTNYP